MYISYLAYVPQAGTLAVARHPNTIYLTGDVLIKYRSALGIAVENPQPWWASAGSGEDLQRKARAEGNVLKSVWELL
jgi:hypothetical protein